MLYEAYRPKTWEEFIGQDKAVSVVRRIMERPGFDRGAFWIEGAGDNNSGIGKTTLALLIARTLADDFFVEQVGGGELTRVRLREIEKSAHLTSRLSMHL